MSRPTPPSNPAVAAIMRDEFESRLLGEVGELAVPRAEAPLPLPPPRFEIPKPDWEAEERERREREAAEEDRR